LRLLFSKIAVLEVFLREQAPKLIREFYACNRNYTSNSDSGCNAFEDREKYFLGIFFINIPSNCFGKFN